MSTYMPGARVAHIDGANGTVVRVNVDTGAIVIRWDDGTSNDWDTGEQAQMIRTGTLPAE